MDTHALIKIKEFKKELEDANVDPDRVVFFGSRTTDNYRDDSDIDLLVVSKKFRGVNVLKRGVMLYKHWNLDYPVDFICLTPEEFNERKNRFSIVSEALVAGVVV
ncbi:MAG: nucleotidyltransferase [Thermoplasmata archaeon HGW-Thermoplasmata-1]|nr:MAG: nucleotidyltransferase [Thermoplasmata archaeon HGW-Thermoplasmata-1]